MGMVSECQVNDTVTWTNAHPNTKEIRLTALSSSITINQPIENVFAFIISAEKQRLGSP